MLAALRYGAQCRARVNIGPGDKTFLVQPGGLQAELRNVLVRFEGFLLGPELATWNPKLESWPPGSCAYGEAGCSRRSGASPEFARSQWSLLHLHGSVNVTLEGPGGIRAPGSSFWAVRNARPAVRGYCLLKLEQSQHVRVSGLALADSPMYQVVVMRSHDVDLQGLRIAVRDARLGDDGPHNTDGVSIIASHHVRLRDSEIESGDDNVVIKEGSHMIHVEGLQLRRGKGISIGSLGERGAEDQVVTDVLFRNVSVQQSVHGARIKTWQGGRGLVRNVSFEDFRVRDVSFGILIDQLYCPPSQRPEGCDSDAGAAISIQDMRFRDFTGTYLQEDRKVACVLCSNLQFERVLLLRSPLASPLPSAPPRALPPAARAWRRFPARRRSPARLPRNGWR